MQVLSSLSSIPFYAPSAGFAPTNSADVSAIASAYQVVSATATQLYAGTAYVTSVNDNPLSASRAGNAANASMANSAYYDGTGRLISALPDSATVSAIASGYAAPKLDTSALDKWQTGDEPVLAYSGINGIPIHPTAADYAHESDYAESADSATYAESADYWIDASSKQDALTFGYNAENKISGINGSALAGGGGGGLVTAIGTSESGITSINNSGLVDTAALRSADYSSLYVQEPLYISASGDSSYIGISGDVGGVDSATCSAIASAYAESAVSSVSGNYALSSDVSATVDLVGTQSANWGGSALALSAGPGVKLEKVGDTLVASTDETVLFSAATTAGSNVQTFTLSEPYGNFDRIKMYYRINDGDAGCTECLTTNRQFDAITWAGYGPSATATRIGKALRYYLTAGNQISAAPSAILFNGSLVNESYNSFYVQRIYGINRTAEA